MNRPKYLVDEAVLLHVMLHLRYSNNWHEGGSEIEAVLNAGPVPEPRDMSDEAMLKAWHEVEDYQDTFQDTWEECWRYLRGDK